VRILNSFRHTLEDYRGFDRRVWALVYGRIINALGFSMVFPFLAIYLHAERGLSMQAVGLVLLVTGAARVSGPLICGIITDHVGRRRLMAGGPALQAVFFTALAAAVHVQASIAVLSVLLFVVQFLGNFFHSTADTYLADIVPPGRRAEAYGLTSIGLNIGWMLGPAVGAFLVRTPYSLLFAITAVCSAILAVMVLRLLPETRASSAGQQRFSDSISVFWEQPRFLLFCLASLAVFITSGQLAATLAVFATEIAGISRPQLGFGYTLNGIIVILCTVPLGLMMKRTGYRYRQIMGGLLFAGGYVGMATARSFHEFLLWLTVVSVAEIFMYPAGTAMATSYATPETMGRYIGMYSLMRGAGQTLGPWLGSTLYGVFGGGSLITWGLIALFAAAGVLVLLWPGLEPKPKSG
jgi:MFS family permease